MSSEERIKNQLLYNSVRIRKEGKTVGSGFLYVPVEEQRGEYAYVLTAAHIFDKFDCPLVCQVFYNKRERKEYDFIVQSNQVIIHDNYEKGKGEAIFQEYDAAIIKVPYREWMSQMRVIYFGKPYEFLSVDGITYSSATKDEDIRYDYYIIKETKLNDLYEDSLRMRIQVTGDFILNHANRKMEISGMSGTVLAAENEDIFLTGVFVSIAEANGAFGKANLIKMDAHIELLEKEGLHLVVHELQRENNNLSTYRILSEKGLSSDWHFVHREEDFQKVKRQLESNGLVVLAGMGGIGKTSLARQYACQYKTSYKAVHQISCKSPFIKGWQRAYPFMASHV